jgi:hypothetical protein
MEFPSGLLACAVNWAADRPLVFDYSSRSPNPEVYDVDRAGGERVGGELPIVQQRRLNEPWLQ